MQQIQAPPPPVQAQYPAPAQQPPTPVERLGWLTAADARARVLRDALQAIALLIAAAWGFYTFVYEQVIVPRNRPAALVVTPVLEAIGRRGDLVLAKATFVMANHSDSKVYVPAMWYTVRGLKLEQVEQNDSAYLNANRKAAQELFATARFSQFTAADLVGTGKVSTEVETWFEPGAEQRVEQLLYIPADRYDAAQLQVQYLITKDIGDVKEVRWRTTDQGDLDPRLVFAAGSKYFGNGAPAEMSDRDTRYLGWLRATRAGVNYVTATIPLWGDRPAAPAKPQAAPGA
ncbi:MAG TPA: hypothetical protein VJT67_06820 [Longimicrobiaceae bacterium]|nr:hypothetical protein [Longimicrobiaceae bacterium]